MQLISQKRQFYLQISYIKTESQKAKLADEWNACSGGFGVMRGHLEPIDGWLCTTQKPSDVLNPSDY